MIHHSDRGSHVGVRYTERLAEAGIEPSVGSACDAYQLGGSQQAEGHEADS